MPAVRAAEPSDWTRGDTPGTEVAAHFNAAGSALPTRQVLDAQKAYLDAESTIGGYEATVEHADGLRRPYDALAALLNCSPDEIAIVQSATTAWQQAFFGLQFAEGDRILTSVHEYATNFINFLQAQRRHGVKIEVVPETEDGDIDVEALERMAASEPQPKLVAISHVATNSGRVYDAAAVGRVTRRHGIPYLLDACQSVGQLPLDVAALGCDWLSGTSRKYLRGPRGIGFLYASRQIMACTEPAMLDLWGGEWTARDEYQPQPTARRYEQYEVAFAAKVGLGVAVQQLLDLDQVFVWGRIQALAARLRQGLAGVPGVAVRDRGRLLCGIVSWTKEGKEPEDMKRVLREQHGIHVWVSPLSSTRIDMEARGLASCVRSSVHYYNTEGEVDKLIAAARTL